MRTMDKDHEGINIQDSYLGRARKDRAWLTVFLNSGKKIVGRIKSFDRYTVILEERGGEQMIFKHAIATISVSRNFGNQINFEKTGRRSETPGREAPGGGPAGEEHGPLLSGPPPAKPPAAD